MSAKSSREEAQKSSRVETIINAQEQMINSFADYLKKAADKTLQGKFQPSELVKDYADLWRGWAKSFAEITRAVLKD